MRSTRLMAFPLVPPWCWTQLSKSINSTFCETNVMLWSTVRRNVMGSSDAMAEEFEELLILSNLCIK